MYKIFTNSQDNITVIMRLSDEMFIPMDEANTDYQAYLKWVAEGGVVLPADEQGEAS